MPETREDCASPVAIMATSFPAIPEFPSGSPARTTPAFCEADAADRLVDVAADRLGDDAATPLAEPAAGRLADAGDPPVLPMSTDTGPSACGSGRFRSSRTLFAMPEPDRDPTISTAEAPPGTRRSLYDASAV
ncbi:MAG: hypothetical protein LBR22_06805 [Desulfovibrio sp.]|nr:hypothetical protein [Desulfovibrio sp.]